MVEGLGEKKKLRLEERFSSCISVPIELNRTGRILLSPTVNRNATTSNTTVSIRNKFTYHLRSRRLLSDKLMLLFQTEIQKEIREHPSGKTSAT